MPVLYEELAKIYDITSPYINYGAEADLFITQSHVTEKSRVLDVACGSGKHLEQFEQKLPGAQLMGIDLAEGILSIARHRVPKAKFILGNMSDFLIPNTKFDLIYCASSSIQYNLTMDSLYKTLYNFKQHCTPDGFMIFDTRFCKERWIEGYKKDATFENDELKIREHWVSKSVNGISIWDPVYDIFNKANGTTKTVTDHHEIKIFSVADILQTLNALGLKAGTVDIQGNPTKDYKNKAFFFVVKNNQKSI